MNDCHSASLARTIVFRTSKMVDNLIITCPTTHDLTNFGKLLLYVSLTVAGISSSSLLHATSSLL